MVLDHVDMSTVHRVDNDYSRGLQTYDEMCIKILGKELFYHEMCWFEYELNGEKHKVQVRLGKWDLFCRQ
jgi:hypothetical protein